MVPLVQFPSIQPHAQLDLVAQRNAVIADLRNFRLQLARFRKRVDAKRMQMKALLLIEPQRVRVVVRSFQFVCTVQPDDRAACALTLSTKETRSSIKILAAWLKYLSVRYRMQEELLEQLTAQLSRLSEISPGMLEARLASPYVMGPFRFETAGELFNFALMHESIHLGVITSQLKTI